VAPGEGATMMKVVRWIVLGLVLVVFALAAFTIFQPPRTPPAMRSYTYSDFVAAVEAGKVDEVVFQGASITGQFKDGSSFYTLAPHTQLIPALTDRLLAGKVIVAARPGDSSEVHRAVSLVVSWLPFVISLVSLWLFIGRPITALTRRLDAYIKAAHDAAGGNAA
jgi:cell division protease FtsH